MKVAIIHYWFTTHRGGEKVVEAILKIFPNADIFCHVIDRKKYEHLFENRKVTTSFINKLPFAKKLYPLYLPLMPHALEKLDLSDYDLIISSESGPAKGVITRPDSIHICYCHSPMRYLWDLSNEYIKDFNFILRTFFRLVFHRMRVWDVISSFRVDHFIANSSFISKRISKFYKRQSSIIHPPVATSHFDNKFLARKDFYLIAGQLVSYKKVDIAIEAFKSIDRRLVIVGEGPMLRKLKSSAGQNISFTGYVTNEELENYYSSCRALIFPGLEDFGMVPIEAMNKGAPVIAFKGGGALDYVVHKKTGIFFNKQNSDSLLNAIIEFEKTTFNHLEIHNSSLTFSEENFQKKMSKFINNIFNVNDKK